jgi:hypothetical protein
MLFPWRGGGPRPVRTEQHMGRRTMITIAEDVDGWISWAGKRKADSMASYLMQLAREDRDRTLAEGGKDAEMYRAYLKGLGMEDELEAVKDR